MNALLLSAGEGTRLRPLTLTTPKCLLPSVNNGPILKYWIDTLIEAGVDKIFINVWYLRRQIIEYVYSLDADIRNHIVIHNEYYLEPVGEVLFKLRDQLGERFLIINSDTYIEKDQVKDFIETNKNSLQIPVIATEKIDNVEGKGLVIYSFSSKSQRLIADFIEKPEGNNPGHVWAGIAILSKDVIDSYSEENLIKMELAADIFPDLANRMFGYEITGAIDIGGSLEIYNQVCEKFARGKL